MKQEKYAKMPKIQNSDRKWPSAELAVSPEWCAVDLRDGNQALPNPMTPEQKLEYFQLLVDLGFKQIEVGFPSASEDDFAFCRELIEKNLIPDDVVISVLTQSRSHLIKRTVEALRGVKHAVIHQYIATSKLHMKHVFGLTEDDVTKTALDSCQLIKREVEPLIKDGSIIGLEFSPEEFTDTDLDFAVELCMKIVETWDPAKDEKVILNLPMTVERRLPNEYADMVEVFMKKNRYPDKTIISVHAHNDMGCAVAATTMTLMAGAQRVEGTLLGHGERTGNVDLITLALNLEYLGVETGLDFSDLDNVVNTIERVTDMPVHPRHPYSGQLVFTAFSGSHQDAINKGLGQRKTLADDFGGWKIPYLHVDPSTLGRKFEKFIRINSQSGKGGIAYVMKAAFNVDMPRWVQTDFASHVQQYADKISREISSEELWAVFDDTYLHLDKPAKLIQYWPRPDDSDPRVIHGEVKLTFNEKEYLQKAEGNGPISALVAAIRHIDGVPDFTLDDYFEDSIGHTADAQAVCFVKILHHDKLYIGAGIDPNVNQAAVKAVFSGINRIYQ